MPDTKHVYPTHTHKEDLEHACRVLIYVYIHWRPLQGQAEWKYMYQCSCIFITKNTCKKYYNIYICWIFPLNYVTPKTASFKYSNTLYLDNLPVTQAEPCTEIRCKYKFRVPDFSNTLSDSMVNEILLRTSLKQPGHSTTEPALDNESRHLCK